MKESMKERLLKSLGGCTSGGFLALGAYNAFLLAQYFKGARHSFPLSAELLLNDAAVFAAAFLALSALSLALHSLKRRKDAGGNGPV